MAAAPSPNARRRTCAALSRPVRADEYLALDAAALADLIARGEVTPEEALDAALARADDVEPTIGALSARFENLARQAIAEGLPAGPFRGVPYLLKDLYVGMAGTPLQNGSRLFAGHVCEHDHTIVTRLKAAGLVIFGRTKSPEFGLNVSTEPLAYGPARNPWDPTRSAGGSSGGAAAAVAAGIVPAAHATDGGGSIRIPASSCGLVGLKPSRGRNPSGPVAGEGWSGMSVGHAVTRTVRDTARLLDATHGPEPGDPYAATPPERPFAQEIGRDPGRLRIALVTETLLGTDIDTECLAATEAAGRLCEDLGHYVEPTRLPIDGDAFREALTVIVAANTASSLDGAVEATGVAASEATVERVTLAFAAMGRDFPAPDLASANVHVQVMTRQLGHFFEAYDVALTPTLGGPPPPLGVMDQNLASLDTFIERTLRHIPFTQIYNATGCPAISLPLAWSDAGPPLGTMFGTRLGGEGLLLRLAAQFEAAQPWADKRPPL